MVVEVGVLVAIPNIKVASYDYCVFYVHNVVEKTLQDYLVTIWVNIDNKVYILIIVEGQEVYVSVVDNVWSKGESHA